MIFKKLLHTYFSFKAKRMVDHSEFNNKLHIPRRPMNEWTVAFLTTGGVHLKSQPGFDVEAGDHTVRLIPSNATQTDLMITHTHYDTTDAAKDVNCIFPIDMLTDLEKERVIGKKAEHFYGMMGYIPNTEALIKETIPQIIAQLKLEKVDVLLLSPG